MFKIQNIVSVTDFRTNIAQLLENLTEPLVIIQNSKPKAIVIDPEYLEYLERYANGFYDSGDVAEVKRAIDHKEELIPFNPEDYA